MSIAPAENPQEVPDTLRVTAEVAPANPEALMESEEAEMDKKLVQHESDVEKKKLSEEIKEQIQDPEKPVVEANLDDLKERVPKVEKVLSNAERLHKDMEATQEVVTGTISTAYDYAKKHVLQPMVEQTKDWFLIGPLIGSLSELTSEQISNAISKKWNQFLATAETFAGDDPTGFFGKTLSNIAEGAKQKLAFLDMKEVIEGYRAEKKPNETIVLEEKLSAEEWKKMKEALAKDPVAMKAKVINIIEKRRQAGILTINITSTDLLQTAEENEEATKKEKILNLQNTVLKRAAWKESGVTEVEFVSTETSLEGGKLKVDQVDLDESGNAKPNTKASALLEATKEISGAKIIIAHDLKDQVTLNWNLPKTVTLPMKTATSKQIINELINMHRPDSFSILEIGPNDSIMPDEVQLERGENGNVLIAENNQNVLAAIALGQPKIDTPEKSPKYKYDNGSFTMMPTPMPTGT